MRCRYSVGWVTCARVYRDNRILSIGGGTREVMNEIISKQMGL